MRHTHNNLLVLIFFLLGIVCTLQAQVSGQLLDEEQQPVTFASILLLSATDSVLVKGDISNEEGDFLFEFVPPGEYLLKTGFLGYQDAWYSPIIIDERQTAIKVPSIILQTATIGVGEEVEVVATKPLYEYHIDRLVVNVQHSITSAGSTALEVLERSPGILVDRSSNQISMSGKSGVAIMINEKLSRIPMEAIVAMLDAMPAENIAHIEIITTPPANFDAEGNSGIINIVLQKKPDEGFSGATSLSVGYGVNEKYGGSLNIQYNQGPIFLFGGLSGRYNHTDHLFENYRSYNDAGVMRESSTQSFRDPTSTTLNGRVGLDFQLSPRTVLGFLGVYSRRDRETIGDNRQNVFADQQLIQHVQINYHQESIWSSYIANINLNHTLASGGKLNADIDYGYYINDNPSNYTNCFFDHLLEPTNTSEVRAAKNTPIDIWVAKLDYSNAISEQFSLEAGIKGTFTKFENDFSVENFIAGTWQNDPRYLAQYFLDETIAAAYASVEWDLSEKTDIKAGLRYEQTDTELGDQTSSELIVNRNYGNFFPSAFLTHKLKEQQELHFSYSRRISRPAFRELAPYTVFFDPTTIHTGNEQLQPGISNTYKIGLRIKKLYISTDYSYTKDDITSFQPRLDQATGEQINAPINLDNRQNLSFDIALPITITKWWRTRNSTSVFWQSNTATFGDVEVENLATTFSISTSHNFRLPKGYSAQFSGFYYSPFTNGLITYDGLVGLNIGIRKRLPNNKGSFRLNFRNLSAKSNWRGSYNQPLLNLEYQGYNGIAEPYAMLTYSRNFGNGKLKTERNRETGSTNEQERIGE